MAGGDCTVLVGALAAAKERLGRVGLAFVDGHLDPSDGETSPSGRRPIWIWRFVSGHGPEGWWTWLAGSRSRSRETSWSWVTGPILRKRGGPRETDLEDERIQLVEAPAIKRGDPERLGLYVAERLEHKLDTSGCTSTWMSSTKRRCRP